MCILEVKLKENCKLIKFNVYNFNITLKCQILLLQKIN